MSLSLSSSTDSPFPVDSFLTAVSSLIFEGAGHLLLLFDLGLSLHLRFFLEFEVCFDLWLGFDLGC